jgi:predicted dehydrogenase
MLRFIHVGTGGFGAYWCQHVLRRLVELGRAEPAAAVDINPEAVKNAQEAYGVPPDRCYTDARKAFDEVEADFAVIVVPPAYHEEIATLAIDRGLHVLMEKPLADTMEASCRIYHRARQAGIKMAITMSHRFDQDKQSLERAVRSGAYGSLNYLVGRNTWNFRKFGSWGAWRHQIPDALLIEGTVHHFDIMRSLANSNAVTVFANTWNPPWGEFAGDSTGFIVVEMENGVRVFYEGAKCNAAGLNPWGQDYWRAECEFATLVLDNRRLRYVSDLSGQREEKEIPLAEQPAWMNPWLAEMFVDWLEGGPPVPTHVEDNIQCAALLFAALESAHTGRVVDVQDYLAHHLSALR